MTVQTVEVRQIARGVYEVRLPEDYEGNVTLHCTGCLIQKVRREELSHPTSGTVLLNENLDSHSPAR